MEIGNSIKLCREEWLFLQARLSGLFALLVKKHSSHRPHSRNLELKTTVPFGTDGLQRNQGVDKG
jgi:hypothetical protein